jgi:hypothetical protein
VWREESRKCMDIERENMEANMRERKITENMDAKMRERKITDM